MIIQTWGNVLEASFQGLWAGVISFIPNLIIAIVIVLIGWGIASILQKVVKKFFDTVKFDEALEKAGLGNVVRRAGEIFLTIHTKRF
jgi:hypothetical protein